MEREAGVCGQQGAGEFLRGADPQDPPQTMAQQWGGLGQTECKEWAGGSGDPPPTMALASPPQTGSGPAYQLTAATGATRVTPTPALLCVLTTAATSLGWDGHGILSKTFPLQNNPSKYVFGNGLLI